MKKSVCLLLASAAVIGLASVLLKKKGKPNLKINCRCKKCSDKTEQAITSTDFKKNDTLEVALPANTKRRPISIGLNNASIGNATYNILLK